MQEFNENITAVDLFCGIGGLTHGLLKEGIKVSAGIDIDENCKYAYEKNNDAIFINKSIRDVKGNELETLYPANSIKVLVGCAPCQTFSTHTLKIKNREEDKRWNLLYEFTRLIKEINPKIVSMENVPQLRKYQVFTDFISQLELMGYNVFWKVVYCPNYGIPQSRRRLVLLASKFGKIELIPETHDSNKYKTVKSTIGKLQPIKDGEVSKKDKLHRSWGLSQINKKRIQQSKQGGSWRDWSIELRTNCHKKKSGSTYSAVYGRMSYEKTSPTITTQFYSFGTGRFGHPTQDRALSLREGALLQTFPKYYKFVEPKKQISFNEVGTHIGNAVPVMLGRVIAKSIKNHIKITKNGN